MSRYQIILKPQAIEDLDKIQKYYASKIIDGIEIHLSYRPDFLSKSRIKRLRGKQESDFRLRIDDYRIFYNIDKLEKVVYILRILHKNETTQFYRKEN